MVNLDSWPWHAQCEVFQNLVVLFIALETEYIVVQSLSPLSYWELHAQSLARRTQTIALHRYGRIAGWEQLGLNHGSIPICAHHCWCKDSRMVQCGFCSLLPAPTKVCLPRMSWNVWWRQVSTSTPGCHQHHGSYGWHGCYGWHAHGRWLPCCAGLRAPQPTATPSATVANSSNTSSSAGKGAVGTWSGDHAIQPSFDSPHGLDFVNANSKAPSWLSFQYHSVPFKESQNVWA